MPVATNKLITDYKHTIMLLKMFAPIRIGSHWQNIGNRYSTLVTVDKSSVNHSMCKL